MTTPVPRVSARPGAPLGLPDDTVTTRRVPWAILGCAVVAALTLLAPFAPTYDPWAWLIWGREILHLDLTTTYGPSWKPLPVALTTIYALAGGAAPLLWVLTARIGALIGVLLAFRLTRRIAGPRAGFAAAAALLVAPWVVRNAAVGNSEGLQIALAFAAIDRALEGRGRTAFALGLGLGLLRPEAWPFVGLFGAWLVWRERRRLLEVTVGLVALPALWLVPEKIGSGDWLRAADRAKNPVSGTPGQAAHPFTSVLHEGWSMLGGPLRWTLVVALLLALWRRDRLVLVPAGLIGAWTMIVAIMAVRGYPGTPRYLIVPAALAVVVAVAGVARGASGLWRTRARPAWLAPAALVGLAALLVIPWLAPTRTALIEVDYEARLAHQLGPLVDRAGGVAALRRCGAIITGPFLVPAVAWRLHVHIDQMGLVPHNPGVVFRERTRSGERLVPSLAPLGPTPVHTLATSPGWVVASTCPAAR